MPVLNWIGKEKVVNHHLDVPYQALSRLYSFDEKGCHEADNGSGNKIIHGDNLAALKSLLPEYEGKVKCIYIDPPYNTGNESWVYNDAVNDPRMKAWLGQVVGKEGEDLSRHDKWLCMMVPRLKLLQRLLSDDGSLVISIGYQEVHNLLAVCNEIFASKQIVLVTVQTSGGKPSSGFNYTQEYLIFIVPKEFTPHALDFCGGNHRTPFEGLTLSTFNKVQRPNQVYPIFINKKDGTFGGVGLSLQEQIDAGLYIGEKEDFPYDFSVAPEGMAAIWPITTKGKQCVWRQISSRLKHDWDKGYIKISANRNKHQANQYSIQYLPSGVIKKIENGELTVIGHEIGVPTLILGENQTVGGQIPTIWNEKSFFTVNGTQLLKQIFPEEVKVFDYSKPVDLLYNVIQALTDKDSIVLDSFAGSGTTAHAVLDLNKKDGGQRKFILIEMMDYAETITAERVRRVITGYRRDEEDLLYDREVTAKDLTEGPAILAEAEAVYQEAKGRYDKVTKPKITEGRLQVRGTKKAASMAAGLGGDFSYYELGEPLLTEEGLLNEAAGEEAIRRYVYFMETREPLPPRQAEEPYLLGLSHGGAYYFYYKDGEATALNRAFLASVRTKAASYVVYADRCFLSDEELACFHIRFKKIPRDIARL